RVVVVEAAQLADCVHKPGAGRERPGAEVPARSFAHHTPILDAFRFVEPPHCDPFAHALTVSVWTRERPHGIRPCTGGAGCNAPRGSLDQDSRQPGETSLMNWRRDSVRGVRSDEAALQYKGSSNEET